MAQEVTISYKDLATTCSAHKGITLLDVSRLNQIQHLHECGGMGMCSTCRVKVISGIDNLSSPSKAEANMAKQRDWDKNIRLACQARVEGDVDIERIVNSPMDINSLQTELYTNLGREKEIAILVCDMRDFTPMTASNLRFDMAHVLNRFYTVLGNPIIQNNGFIYQYIGDSIIAVFGLGRGDAGEVCTQAMRSAINMNRAIAWLNKTEMHAFGITLEIGIGLHYGHSFIGNLGHPKYRKFTVVGDTINIASRTQDSTKTLECTILATEEFLVTLPDDLFKFGRSFEPQFKGIEERIGVREVLGFAGDDDLSLIHSSISRISGEESNFPDLFYNRLFKIDPGLREIFPDNMTTQKQLLKHMLNGIVFACSRPWNLETGLKKLGKNHLEYGVKDEHYVILKEAFLLSLKDFLGDEFDEQMKNAWDHTLVFIAETMLAK